MQKITTCLTFNDKAEEAMNFYISVFSSSGRKNSKVLEVTRYGEVGPLPKGTLLGATFQLDGQKFMVLNGGSYFTFGQGISLYINCETQEEIDEFWEKLSEGGEKQQCGWLKDKYGVSWQVAPPILGELLNDKDPEKSKRVMNTMLKMYKIDIKVLRQAYEQN